MNTSTPQKVIQLQPETTLTPEQKTSLCIAVERAAADYTASHLQRPTHIESQDTYRLPWPEGVEPAIVDPGYFAEPVESVVIAFRAKRHRTETVVYISLESATGLREHQTCVHVMAAGDTTQVNYWPKQMGQVTLDVIISTLDTCVAANL